MYSFFLQTVFYRLVHRQGILFTLSVNFVLFAVRRVEKSKKVKLRKLVKRHAVWKVSPRTLFKHPDPKLIQSIPLALFENGILYSIFEKNTSRHRPVFYKD